MRIMPEGRKFETGVLNPNWRGGPVTLVCLACQKEFLNPQPLKPRKFCGHSCKARYYYERNKKHLIHNGSTNPNWKGGVTPITQLMRKSPEYRLWRKTVFERDNYTCLSCGYNKGKILNADHIKPWALYPDLRFNVENGRTLCIPCHKSTETYGNLKNYKAKASIS